MRHKFISLILAVWLLLVLPTTALAQGFDPDHLGSISVTLKGPDGETPIIGAEFALYHVAAVSLNSENHLSYTFTPAFEACGAALDDPALSGKLDVFVKEYAVPAEKLVTDAQGKVVFSNLPLGLYFLKQTNAVEGYAPCKSFTVSVPDRSDGRYIYDVKAKPKTALAKFTDITIKKVWDVDDITMIADQVEVDLLRDGLTVRTAVLNEANNWEITYSDMPESDAYSIVEVNVPEGFTAFYTSRGYAFTVVNRISSGIGGDDPGDPDHPGSPGDPDDPMPEGGTEYPPLPQTGQLVWPIPVLALAGLCLITIGTIVLSKTRSDYA